MARHYCELLEASRRLLRQPGERGRLSTARIRRSVSTAYYALFHFLVEEAGLLLVGTGGRLRQRRRMLARMFTHQGIKQAARRLNAAHIDMHVAGFMVQGEQVGGRVATPGYVRRLATVFIDAQVQRNEADYNLNLPLWERDAAQLIEQVTDAITGWDAAASAEDKDFKRAVALLMLLKGNLRKPDGE